MEVIANVSDYKVPDLPLQGAAGGKGVARRMGCDDDPRLIPQRMLRRQRLARSLTEQPAGQVSE